MKKLFFVCGIAIIGFNSCKKKEVIETPISSGSISLNTQMATRTFYDHGGDNHEQDYGCAVPATNCLNTATVGPAIKQDIENLFTILETTKDSVKISNYFNQNKESLSKIFEPWLVNGVIESRINVKSRGKNLDIAKYVIFSDSEILKVYPFSTKM